MIAFTHDSVCYTSFDSVPTTTKTKTPVFHIPSMLCCHSVGSIVLHFPEKGRSMCGWWWRCMKRYEDNADCVYPDSFGWKSLGYTNTFEERFTDISFNNGRPSVSEYIIDTFLPLVVDFLFFLFCIFKALLLVFCYQIECFKLFGENYPLHKMMVTMVGHYTAEDFLNILYIFLYLIFTKNWWGRNDQYCYFMDRETETHRNLWTYPSWSL